MWFKLDLTRLFWLWLLCCIIMNMCIVVGNYKIWWNFMLNLTRSLWWWLLCTLAGKYFLYRNNWYMYIRVYSQWCLCSILSLSKFSVIYDMVTKPYHVSNQERQFSAYFALLQHCIRQCRQFYYYTNKSIPRWQRTYIVFCILVGSTSFSM